MTKNREPFTAQQESTLCDLITECRRKPHDRQTWLVVADWLEQQADFRAKHWQAAAEYKPTEYELSALCTFHDWGTSFIRSRRPNDPTQPRPFDGPDFYTRPTLKIGDVYKRVNATRKGTQHESNIMAEISSALINLHTLHLIEVPETEWILFLSADFWKMHIRNLSVCADPDNNRNIISGSWSAENYGWQASGYDIKNDGWEQHREQCFAQNANLTELGQLVWLAQLHDRLQASLSKPDGMVSMIKRISELP